MISVIIRATLTQLATPDEMRGTRDRRGHDLHRNLERVRAIRIGRDRAMVWHGPRGGIGRRRDAGRDRAVGMAVSGTAACGRT